MKKFASVLLATLLVLALTVSAFAVGTGTITVNGAENGLSYPLYKIFDVTTVDGNDVYSIPSGRDYSATANFSTLFETNTTAGVTYVTRKTNDDAAIVAWAKASISSFGSAVATVQAANGKVEYTGLDNGYYYVNSPVNSGATAMIADTNQTHVINEKNSTPGWGDNGGKTADGVTYYAGDTITYTLSYQHAVNYDRGEQVTKYIIEDTLPTGITYTGNLTAKVNGNTVSLTEEGAQPANGFKVSVAWVNGSNESLYTVNPSTIEVTYTATMGNSVVGTAIRNTAKIYPDTNTTPGGETEQGDDVYTGRIVLTKVDNADTTKTLSGAKFKIKVGTSYLKLDGTTFSEVAEAEATVFETNAAGQINLSGLKAGTYVFVETEAPAGYNLPANPEVASVTLSVDESSATVVVEMDKTQQVNNSKAASTPETGGTGTTICYVVGGLLAAAAVILLITRKRAREN